MTRFILFPFFFLFFGVNAQLVANAGNDTTICVSWNFTGPLELGSYPTAVGGTAPYSYLWEANYYFQILTTTYLNTASDFLSDTTVSNPSLIHTVENPVMFKLTVTDAIGQIDIDTILVSFSIFNTHLVQYNHSMILGDSVEFTSLPNVDGGIPPLSYLWRPNNGLTDSISYTNFWVKPEISTDYYLTVTDSVGCVVSGAPVFFVFIGYVSLNEVFNSNNQDFTVFPNPSNGQIHLNLDNKKIQKIILFNDLGLVVKEIDDFQNEYIDMSELKDGSYLIEIISNGKSTTKKIIKTK